MSGFSRKGIYFYSRALQAHKSSYKPFTCHDVSRSLEGRTTEEGEHEILLAKLLASQSIFMDRDASTEMAKQCRSLTSPPVNPETSEVYSSVTGKFKGSQVWIVYGAC